MIKNEKQPEIADIFHSYGQDYRQNNFLSSEQCKAMRHIEMCRTAALGGHIEVCDHCGVVLNAYNSCRDRHCPKCQTLVKEKWHRQEGGITAVSLFPQCLYAVT